ncbi:dihydrofolate reductase [Shimazuella sp. AN120528]|uniref:dihydrofolate reductase family protein n=1 Tax=Shimazuella soli TaxID=1892854 RepID=UPI001F0F2C6D|nr:dihydrofolate reductase [Shimazuella soli]MCH5585377.1 dihydrofolate reductase [Shimazuella soli]
MKTILWATLSANGNYAQSSPENPPKKEALEDFITHAKAAGNFIVGRKTFEGMLASGGGGEDFANLDIVVISRSNKEIPGATIVSSPQEALQFLNEKGHHTALLSGGADLHNSFLTENLVDEIVLNIAPVLEGKGLNLLINKSKYTFKPIELLNVKSLGNGVVHLHYKV